MNQISTRLAQPLGGPAAGIGGVLLTRLDLSLEETIKDAAHELRRCTDDAALAAWARKWGDLATDRLLNVDAFDDDAWVPKDTHDEVDSALSDLMEASTKAADEITAALKGSVGPKTEAINLIVATLREAIENAEIEE